MSDGLKLPQGEKDRRRWESIIKRIESLEERIAKLEKARRGPGRPPKSEG